MSLIRYFTNPRTGASLSTSFVRLDDNGDTIKGSEYHIQIGLSLKDGETGIAREREALEDLEGQNVTFEAYAKACDKRKG